MSDTEPETKGALPEWGVHIRHSHAKLPWKAWCGAYISEFAFVSLDHAAYNNLNGDRLVPCKECVRAALHALSLFTVGTDGEVMSCSKEPNEATQRWRKDFTIEPEPTG